MADEEQSRAEEVLKLINTWMGKKVAGWQPSNGSGVTRHEIANLPVGMHLVSEK